MVYIFYMDENLGENLTDRIQISLPKEVLDWYREEADKDALPISVVLRPILIQHWRENKNE